MSSQILNIGVDVGGTNTKIGLVNDRGSIIARKTIPTDPQQGSETLIRNISEAIGSLLRERGIGPEALRSIGVGVPGTADADTGMVIYAPNIFWRNVPIGPALQSAFHVPVYVTQDTRAAAWAEHLVGTAQNVQSLASVTLGTGIGCGMVLDGKIFHGAMNTAGEFGHQIVELEGKNCNCGRRGCLEAYAGGLAIVREARERIPRVTELLHKRETEITVDDVYRLSEQGHSEARKLTDEVVKYVGIGLVNLINLTSIEMICISGGISNAPQQLLMDPLIAFIRSRAYEMVAGKVRVCRSTLRDDAPLIGASLLFRGLTQSQAAALQLT
jgi:glucokinase